MTKEDLKTQALALIDQAYALGFSEGKAAVPASPPADAPAVSPSQPSLADEYPLTNPAVAAFLADPAYDAPGFATSKGKSVVCNYCEPHPDDYALNTIEHPLPVTIGDTHYWNLVPGSEYTFDGHTFRTTGTVRQIHFPDPATAVANCRDIGGWKCQGGHVAYGKVIRSARLPEGLTKDSLTAQTLRDLGITLEIDLRNKSAYTTLGWRGLKVNMYAYASILTDARGYKDTFSNILNEVQRGGCVLIHCNAGADRTGCVVTLLLGYLGVSEADLIKEWELTCYCYWQNYKIINQWADRIADPKYKAIALEEFPKGELRELFAAMKAAYGKSGETFQQQCAAFLTKKVGLTSAQLSTLKTLLIV